MQNATEKYNHKYSALIKFVVYFAFAGQIIFSLIWMKDNFFSIPKFGDTAEYILLSKYFLLDEFRPILYPFILHIVTNISDFLHIPYQCIVYIIQTFLCVLSIGYMLTVYFNYIKADICIRDYILIVLYFVAIPMVTWLNFSILTDSLALSLLIWMLTNTTIYLYSKSTKICAYVWLQICISFFLQSILRLERPYVCFIFLIIVILQKIYSQINISRRMNRIINIGKFVRKNVFFLIIAPFILIVTVSYINLIKHRTQIPGIHGRIKTTWQFILLDRIVWPNMAANYKYFPEEIRSVITLNDAKKFDRHNNNTMYLLAPKLESSIGTEQARQFYVDMAKIVFNKNKMKILSDITEDIATFIFIPFSALSNYMGYTSGAFGWNVKCMSCTTPKLTRAYRIFFLYSFCLFFAPIALLGNIIWKNTRSNIKYFHHYILMSIILSIFLGCCDGAAPNDRYVLIGYVTWMLLFLNLVVHVLKGNSRYEITAQLPTCQKRREPQSGFPLATQCFQRFMKGRSIQE